MLSVQFSASVRGDSVAVSVSVRCQFVNGSHACSENRAKQKYIYFLGKKYKFEFPALSAVLVQ